MAERPRFWQITGTNGYIDQVMQFSLHDQNNMETALIELSHHENPRSFGSTDICPKDNFIVVIFAGIPFEFIYEIDEKNHRLRFINCRRFEVSHSFSTD